MNDTQGRIAHLSQNLKTRDSWLIIIESVVCSVILLTAFLSNLLLCLAVYKSRMLRNLQVYYLVSLAVTDMSFAGLCMPPMLVVLVAGTWPFGDAVCQLQGFLTSVFASVSLITLTMVALNRYVKITRSADLYQRIFSKKNVLLSIATSWIVCAILGFAALIIGGKAFDFHPGKCLCFLRFDLREKVGRFALCAYSLVVAVTFPPIIFSYCKIFRKVRQHFVHVGSFTSSNAANASNFAAEVKIAKMLFATSFAFFICWSPSVIIDFYEALGAQYTLPRTVYLFNIFTFASSSAVNPLIYGLMRREFMLAYKKAITCNEI